MSRVRGAIEGWVDTKFRSASRLPLVDPVPTCSARSGFLCFVQAGNVKGRGSAGGRGQFDRKTQRKRLARHQVEAGRVVVTNTRKRAANGNPQCRRYNRYPGFRVLSISFEGSSERARRPGRRFEWLGRCMFFCLSIPKLNCARDFWWLPERANFPPFFFFNRKENHHTQTRDK